MLKRMWVLVGVLTFSSPVAAQEEEGGSVADAINAKWGTYKLKWGEHYYSLDKKEEALTDTADKTSGATVAATPVSAGEAVPTAVEEKKSRPKARSLRSGGAATDAMAESSAAGEAALSPQP
jgi:hypothetical protein